LLAGKVAHSVVYRIVSASKGSAWYIHQPLCFSQWANIAAAEPIGADDPNDMVEPPWDVAYFRADLQRGNFIARQARAV
jgi:hypothetical protein